MSTTEEKQEKFAIEMAASASKGALVEKITFAEKREVLRNDEAISLTPTEYRLLEALAEHKGRAVAEFDLIKEVWGQLREEETAAVRRYIFLLRQKIEEDPADPKFIVTVRGFGYRLEIN
jgi:two-component system KDP operon response regulator KdpE